MRHTRGGGQVATVSSAGGGIQRWMEYPHLVPGADGMGEGASEAINGKRLSDAVPPAPASIACEGCVRRLLH